MKLLAEASKVFEGNSALPYAAFNLRVPYYRDIALQNVQFSSFSPNEDQVSADWVIGDIGAGIGISTMEIMRFYTDHYLRKLVALEPSEQMRAMLLLNTMSHPRVEVSDCRAEYIDSLGLQFDVLFAVEMAHLLHPHEGDSLIPRFFQGTANSLKPGGELVFNLGPSNGEFFENTLGDHRSGEKLKAGHIMTEFCHPVYQLAHQLVLEEVGRRWRVQTNSLWPSTKARITNDFLMSTAEQAGFKKVTRREQLYRISGSDVIEFVRNAWAVFFRWGAFSKKPVEERLEVMTRVIEQVMTDPEYSEMVKQDCFHPTVGYRFQKGG